jgi:alpha-amylase
VELVYIPALREMIMVRRHLAYGEQRDYFDHGNVIGWTRAGNPEKPHSGCAVVLSNSEEGNKYMDMGKENANKSFVDITGNRSDKITTNEHGQADFRVNKESVSVWIKESALELIKI